MLTTSNDFLGHLLDAETSLGDFRLEIYEEDGTGRVREGRLVSRKSGCWYRIEDYIIDLLPATLRSDERYRRFANLHGLTVAAKAEESAELRSQQLQIDFFEKDSLVYDHDVSDHPFYKIFDALYMHPWIERLSPSLLVLDVGGGTRTTGAAARARRSPRALYRCV